MKISGFALDRGARVGTGVDKVTLYADGGPGQGTLLGDAAYGDRRDDLARSAGDARFAPSGWHFYWDTSDAAAHEIYVVFHSPATGATTTVRRDLRRPQLCWHEPIGGVEIPPDWSTAISGWAVDRTAASGAGIAKVDLYVDGCPGVGGYLGRATYGWPRPDIADNFSNTDLNGSGWSFDWGTRLPAGPHTLYVVAYSSVNGSTTTFVRMIGGAVPGPLGCFDLPAPGSLVTQTTVLLSGWAADTASANATGIASVTLYDGPPDIGTRIGEARYGAERRDVVVGLSDGRFAPSGWSLLWDELGVPAGEHTLYAVARSNAGDRTTIFKRTISLSARLGDNVARGRPVQASHEWQKYPASLAVDGTVSTGWNAGDFAPQWIEVELGAMIDVGRVRLVPAQLLSGPTVHRILGRGSGDSYRPLAEIRSTTTDGDPIDLVPATPWTGVRYIRIETSASPSWIAWQEIEVYRYDPTAALTRPQQPDHSRVVGNLVFSDGAPAAGVCIQIGAPVCIAVTAGDGSFSYDFDTAALTGSDWTFAYVVDGAHKGSQTIARGTVRNSPFSLATFTLEP